MVEQLVERQATDLADSYFSNKAIGRFSELVETTGRQGDEAQEMARLGGVLAAYAFGPAAPAVVSRWP
ncbi:MAG: hypothetical protein PVF93_07900 [Chromatiaceae bacterium]|jgi:hypothetical protein